MDVNVINVDWSLYSTCEYQHDSVVIAPKLASSINEIIYTLYEYGGYSSQLIHLVGHSLGGQIVGLAGKMASNSSYGKYGRITGRAIGMRNSKRFII